MSQKIRALTLALVLGAVVVVSACGSKASSDSNGTDVQREAAFKRGVQLCVGGGYLLGWTVKFEDAAPPGDGPYRTQDNHCGQSRRDRSAELGARLYRADGTEIAYVLAVNPPAIGLATISVLWKDVPTKCPEVESFWLGYKLQESLYERESKSFDCGSERIVFTRETDTADFQVFQVTTYPI